MTKHINQMINDLLWSLGPALGQVKGQTNRSFLLSKRSVITHKVKEHKAFNVGATLKLSADAVISYCNAKNAGYGLNQLKENLCRASCW